MGVDSASIRGQGKARQGKAPIDVFANAQKRVRWAGCLAGWIDGLILRSERGSEEDTKSILEGEMLH